MHRMISSGQYIAEKILKINERGSWSDPPPEDPAARANQDEQIFQTAKLVKLVALIFYHAARKRLSLSCGHFMSAIMGDYVAGFLGSSEGCNWNMDAFDVSGLFWQYVVYNLLTISIGYQDQGQCLIKRSG